MRTQGGSVRERLLGLAMPERSQKQQQLHEDMELYELSEEEVWEMQASCYHGAAAAAAVKTQKAAAMPDISRKSNLMPKSRSSASLNCQIKYAPARPSAPMEVPRASSAAGLAFTAAAARAHAARSLILARQKLGDSGYGDLLDFDEADNNDDDDVHITPPHLITSRQHPKMGMVSSVIEGAGRTLKGRDLRNVRNAVWKHTGFFG